MSDGINHGHRYFEAGQIPAGKVPERVVPQPSGELTTQQMREYVKSRWDFVAERHNPPTVYRIQLNRIWHENISIGYFKDEASAWASAYKFTLEVERQIAEVDEEIEMLRGYNATADDVVPALRILARLEAARADIAKGYKETK